ncbi:hypothetical protein STRTUCAR8_04830, partial [Streptomyces turgidiscabies Car8]
MPRTATFWVMVRGLRGVRRRPG